MGSGRRHVLGGAAVLCCAVACGGGGGGGPKTTPLPMQPSGLAVGGDVQSQATDVAQTRVSDRQLQKIAGACRKAVEITDPGSDPCARAIRDVMRHRKKCEPGSNCVLMRGFTNPTATGEKGMVKITAPSCGEAPCIQLGIKTEKVLYAVAATTPPPKHSPSKGTSPEETSGPSGTPDDSGTEGPPSEPGTPDETPDGDPGDGSAPVDRGPGPDTSP